MGFGIQLGQEDIKPPSGYLPPGTDYPILIPTLPGERVYLGPPVPAPEPVYDVGAIFRTTVTGQAPNNWWLWIVLAVGAFLMLQNGTRAPAGRGKRRLKR